MNDAKRKLVDEGKASLIRMQEFDAGSIARVEVLGEALNFSAGVPDVRRIVDLFRQIAVEVLPDFSQQRLTELKQVADAEYNRLQQILKFGVTDEKPKATRDALLQQLEQAGDHVFNQIWPSIAYSVRRSVDFARLEHEARAAIQAINDRTSQLEASLIKRKEEAETTLEAIRKVAAEQGVSQQALYFREEAEAHTKQAKVWLRWTAGLSAGLTVYAVGTLFLHKIPWLSPKDEFEAAQLVVGKILIFASIVSFLLLAARNFMAHRHNAVVNKHRQNSLVTYRALVEAAGDQANRDIVLTKAADSIFSSQSTGFTRPGTEDGGPRSMISLSPSMFKTPGGSG